MVFNATFNNILIISWWSVLLLTEFPEKTTDLSQVTDKLYHIMLYQVHLDINYLLFHIMFILNSLTSYFALLIKWGKLNFTRHYQYWDRFDGLILNQCLSALKLCVRFLLLRGVLYTSSSCLCYQVLEIYCRSVVLSIIRFPSPYWTTIS